MTDLEAKPREIVPTSQPISILPSDTARVYTHIHPVLLFVYYYLRFPVIVANPVPALFFDLVPISILQSLYAVLCLPSSMYWKHVPSKPNKTSLPRKAKSSNPKAVSALHIALPNRILVRGPASYAPRPYAINTDRNSLSVNRPFSSLLSGPVYTRTANHHNPDGSTSDDSPCPYPSAGRTYVFTCCSSSVLRVWTRLDHMERGRRRYASV